MAGLILSSKGSQNIKGEIKREAQASKKLERETKTLSKGTLPYIIAHEKKFISQDKIDILNHIAKETYWSGGKGVGKTRPVILRMLGHMEEDKTAQGVAFKKYKTNAASRLHTSVANMALEIKHAGFRIPEYEKGISETYRMIENLKKDNQTIEYGAFDDYNSIAGIEAKNAGWFPIAAFDEPVEQEKAEKLPTIEEWEVNLAAMYDSLERSNSRHMTIFKREVPATKIHYMLNVWGDHPIVLELEKEIPQAKFLEFVLQDLINNNLMAVYNKKTDKLWVRMTKFNMPIVRLIEKMCLDLNINNVEEFETRINDIDWTTSTPNWEEEHWEPITFKDYGISPQYVRNYFKKNENRTLVSKTMEAVEKNDATQLAIILGLKYEPETGDKKAFDDSNVIYTDTSKFNNVDSIPLITYSFDIDHNRRYTLTTEYQAMKIKRWNGILRKNEYYANLITRKQKTFWVDGVPESEREKDNRLDKMASLIKEEMQELINQYGETLIANARHAIVVDDDHNHMINPFKKRFVGLPVIFSRAKKHEEWGIIERTTAQQTQFDEGWIIIDEKNVELRKDWKDAIVREGSLKRDESSTKEKRYDTINSREYGTYLHRSITRSIHTPGKPELYIKEAK